MKDTQSVEWTRPDSEPGFIACVGKPPMEIQQVTERSPTIEAFYGAMSAFDSTGTKFVSISKPFDIFSERIIGSAYVQRYNGSYFGNHVKLSITDTLLPSSLYASYIVISEDGSTIVTNAAGHDNGDVGLGAIFIHQEINEQWVHVRTIVSAEVDTENGQFGFQMSISGDGARIIVSAPSMGNGGSNRGKVFVLDTIDNWTTFTSTLIIPTPTIDEGRFGVNCRISPDGKVLIIGEALPDLSGVVSVFEQRLGVWTQIARLVSSNQAANVLFGSSVINLTRFERYAGDSLSCNSDGSKILIGEAGANGSLGLTYYFTRNGDTWDEAQIIDIPPDIVGSGFVYFGYSVDMNRAGSRIVIGGQGAESPTAFNVGRIVFYELCDGIFELIDSVPAVAAQAGEFMGYSVAISPDGRFMASGATDYSETSSKQGRILLYNADYQFTAPPVVPKPPPIIPPPQQKAWDLTDATYTGKSMLLSAQGVTHYGGQLSADGLQYYSIDWSSDAIYQYTLTQAFDLSTGSYSGVFYSVVAQTGTPISLTFKPDGTELYIANNGDIIYRHTLAIPWNISTASFTSSFTLTQGEGQVRGLTFREDGLTLYVAATFNNRIFQYRLITPWDITTCIYDNKQLYLFPQMNYISRVLFKPDGLVAFLLDDSANPLQRSIYQFNLSVAWDISFATDSGITLDSLNEGSNPVDLYFKSDGLTLYVVNTGSGSSVVFQYTT